MKTTLALFIAYYFVLILFLLLFDFLFTTEPMVKLGLLSDNLDFKAFVLVDKAHGLLMLNL